jgi:hypothetical protein
MDKAQSTEDGMNEYKTAVPVDPQTVLPETAEGPGRRAGDEATPVAAPTQAPKRRPATPLIPDDLLEAARRGMTTREIADILRTRLDRPVSVQAVYERLVRLGIRRPRDLPYDTRSGEVVFTTAEYERLEDYHRRRKADMLTLLKAARAGDRDALISLHHRYGLRLPLVEPHMSPPLPWMLGN